MNAFFVDVGSIALTNSIFSEERAVLLLRDVNCNGSESSLLNCEHNSRLQTNCGPLEDAGVVCQGKYTISVIIFIMHFIYYHELAVSTMAGDCQDGEVRLSEGVVDSENLTMDGRLEICFNNAWGSVCNNFFRAIDAQVACHQLPGFNREGSFNLHIVT